MKTMRDMPCTTMSAIEIQTQLARNSRSTTLTGPARPLIQRSPSGMQAAISTIR